MGSAGRMDFRARLGDNLRRARLTVDISQEDLALRSGLDRTYVSGIERGVRNPTVKVLISLAEVVGIPPAKLLDGIGEPAGKKLR